MAFSQINVKAAAIAGAVIGFLAWFFVMPVGMMPATGFGLYGVMGYMMGYAYSGLGVLTVIFGAVTGAVLGVILAVVYNWALTLK